MEEDVFNEEKILSIEDIIKGVHLKIDKAFTEVIRREKIKDEYYEVLFSLEKSTTRRILRVLQESSGAHRFTEILRIAACSPTTLNNALNELVRTGLARREGKRYQAVSTVLFVQKKLEEKQGKL